MKHRPCSTISLLSVYIPPKHHTNKDTSFYFINISNASCTTNCITPVLRHLVDNYGIKNANFTTIHAATASQKVVDTPASKSRTSRTIFNNMIPTTTGKSVYKFVLGLDGFFSVLGLSSFVCSGALDLQL